MKKHWDFLILVFYVIQTCPVDLHLTLHEVLGVHQIQFEINVQWFLNFFLGVDLLSSLKTAVDPSSSSGAMLNGAGRYVSP